MPRKDPDYLEVHRTADRIEPRVARALLRATPKLRARIPVEELTLALEAGDPAAAGSILDAVDFSDPYIPAGRIVADTVLKGAKLAVDDINEELEK